MTASRAFTCPACGAAFDVQERVEGRPEPAPKEASVEKLAREATEPVSFQCPACGADYDTEDRLDEDQLTNPIEVR